MPVRSLEQAKPEYGLRPVLRPVIHLPNGVVLTRIDPTRKDTSMLFRTRPGWDKLRLWLEGNDGNEQRSVCGGTLCPLQKSSLKITTSCACLQQIVTLHVLSEQMQARRSLVR